MTHSTPLKDAKRSRRGQALVEFALVLPIFTVLLFGTLDFGYLLYSQMTVINAAREGARIATTDPDTTTYGPVVASRVDASAPYLNPAYLQQPVISCVHIVSSGSCSFSTQAGSKPGDGVRVTVTYTYHTLFPFLFGATFNLTATTQMIRQ